MKKVRLYVSAPDGTEEERRHEPLTVGVPFPKTYCRDVRALRLHGTDGRPVPLQGRTLDAWSDGSVRWALLDFFADVVPATASAFELVVADDPRGPAVSDRKAPQSVTVTVKGTEASVETGTHRFQLHPNGSLTGQSLADQEPLRASLHVRDAEGAHLPLRVKGVVCEEAGPLRVAVLVEGELQRSAASSLRLFIRYQFWAGLPAVRVQVTLRNPARAVHAGGYWDLGDPGSCYLKDLSFEIVLPEGEHIREGLCSTELSLPIAATALPLEVYQESSGGENWQSTNHLNRQRVVPAGFRGYRVRAGAAETRAMRATPIVAVTGEDAFVAIAQRQFWERFPKAIEATSNALTFCLLPKQYPDLHEIQPGEQISEDFVFSLGRESIAATPLDWVRRPLWARAEPAWYCEANALPYLIPTTADPSAEHRALVMEALEGPGAFRAKNESIDEYGWRNFGDIYADHEAVFHRGPQALISHYNNQYDAILGCACQLFRSGDGRWWSLMGDLARHLIDIDIYHTAEDKPAYNHGLFWHTAHHTDADLATHRTYPRASPNASGGPSPEHNYNTGLTLYYLLTGDPRAREAAIGLGQWVIDMDDGRRTPLGWLSDAPTGLVSATGSVRYHGPGRAPGNSIVALLNAFRLSGSVAFVAKAEELIRRCIHPADDLPELNLLDAERRWYYTVFLQAIGRYLDFKIERGELDGIYAYARASLLHYARWMAVHEYPYLERPEILEFPNETWPAQDMRKSDVFIYAARHSEGKDRELFTERAHFFFSSSVTTLVKMPTRTLTRPLVLMLTNGHMHAHFATTPLTTAPAPVQAVAFGRPKLFVPQRTAVIRRLVVAGAAGGVIALGALTWLLL